MKKITKKLLYIKNTEIYNGYYKSKLIENKNRIENKCRGTLNEIRNNEMNIVLTLHIINNCKNYPTFV